MKPFFVFLFGAAEDTVALFRRKQKFEFAKHGLQE
jgi:hypothetical protein